MKRRLQILAFIMGLGLLAHAAFQIAMRYW